MDVVEYVISKLDDLKKLTGKGIEYWMARDLMAPLGYVKWENFERAIDRARRACESTGGEPDNHILGARKKVSVGSGAERGRQDYYLSRLGAYLIALNGDPRIPEIAAAQQYFAVQTRRQELTDEASGLVKRMELRDRVKIANKHLGNAAKDSGVEHYGLFHAAGYRGLYDLPLKEIKIRKGIGSKEDLLDRAGRAELAANESSLKKSV